MSDINHEMKWIRLARAGDADAFCRLYGIYRQRLYRYAFYRLGNPSDAEDAVSECILLAWKQIGSLRDSKAFAAWIFRILSGCCGRLIRGQIQGRDQLSLEVLAQEDGAGLLPGAEEDKDGWLLLQEALSGLADTERNILLLSAVGGLKSGEIAELTGLTAGSVRSSLSRSLKKVRGYYE